MSRKRQWIVLLVAVLALTAGCAGGAGNGGGGDGQLAGEEGGFDAQEAEPTPMATGTPVAEAADASGAGGASGGDDYQARQFAERQLILTGQVAIEVEDFEAARRNLTTATEGYGGFVSDTRQEVHRIDNETWTTGMVVLRVPRDNFTVLYERAKTEGELLKANRESQDVTDRLVDIQARLENLRAERDQLRELYQRADETEDVLRVQRRLSDVQGEIERLEARQQALKQRVALSTITVRMEEPRPEPDRPVPERWYDVPLVAAFLESVNGVVVTLRAISVAGAYAAPYLVVFGVPLAAAGYAFRQRRGPRLLERGRRWLAQRRDRSGDVESEPDAAEEPSRKEDTRDDEAQ